MRDDYDDREANRVHRTMDRCVNLLRRAGCDTAQILVTMMRSDGSTGSSQAGSGNWFARVELARTFVEKHENQNFAREVAKAIKDDDEESGAL